MNIERGQVFRCEKCGKMIEVVKGGGPVPECCGQPMVHLAENTVDAAQEKHVPVLEKIDGGFRVKVGEVAHPMGEDHLIEWIELVADGITYRRHLAAGDAPEAVFMLDAQNVAARAYCNLHGFWRG